MPTRPAQRKGSASAGQQPGISPMYPVKPCGQQRDPLDVAGRINDLINCYLIVFAQYVKVYLPQVLLALIALAIMFFAAYIFIKG